MIEEFCPFESLQVVGIPLEQPEDARALMEWFVVFTTGIENDLFWDTNVKALAAALNKEYGDGTAKALDGWRGETIAVVEPSRSAALERAAGYAAMMLQGSHLDLASYAKARAAACAERWYEMSYSERIEMLQNHHGEVGDFRHSDKVPECLMPTLLDLFE